MNRWGARLTVLTPGVSTAVLLLVGPRRADLPGSFAAVPAWLDGDAASRAAALAGLAAWVLTLWLTLAVVTTLAAGTPGHLGRVAAAVSGRIAPAVLRTTLHAGIGAGLGLTIVTGSVAGAGLALTSSPAVAGTRTSTAPGPALGWPDLGRPVGIVTVSPTATPPELAPSWPRLERPSASPAAVPPVAGPVVTSPAPPTRPTTPDAPAPAPLRAGGLTTDPDGFVVVMRGDSLWSLSTDWLRATTGEIPTTAEVAVAWPAWWAANRAVVGDDPGHLLPGQRLVPPAVTTAGP